MTVPTAPTLLYGPAGPLAFDRPRVMGILNVTPDSFSDGGAHDRVDRAVARARQMQDEGADLIDVGGESTRPGAEPVSLAEERRRVLPVLEALAAEVSLPVSVDTMKPEIMRDAVRAGAAMLNDVNAFRRPGAEEEAVAAAREHGVALCVMHMQGEPQSMQHAPHYGDVTAEVRAFLDARCSALQAAGVPPDRLVVDPGFGFGKTLEHNLELFRHLPDLVGDGWPVLVGVSRKSMIGALLGQRPVAERGSGSVAAALLAAQQGARILRVHDVAATADALAIYSALDPRGTDGVMS
ncbi:dihydropteroate synthase [Thioalkalivibrio sp. ALE21]|uniref:dihydropteroate synthase n=1 Tax=Thioalkalivibrio sp. ALE21 TaxID=1158175 RepID=UPI000D8118B8|nr:dihydropteroate synthase [Thioalkalivibrio sp. ALE21]PYG02647.1 dihydropteroate synthase [Thioalkalivibrio sp. ALE21]